MKQYKVALAVWSETYLNDRSLAEMIGNLKPDTRKTVNTPDELYLVFYWDMVPWYGDDVDALCHKLECVRHCLITISEEGDIFKNVETCDKDGCDEEFEEILSWDANIFVWDNLPVDQQISEKRLKEILGRIADLTTEGSETAAAIALLKDAGMTNREISACGLSWLIEDEEFTLDDLNRVLAPLELEAETDITGMISIIDLQGTCALEDELFHCPADVIKRLSDSYLADTYLNGEICCDHEKDFNSYEEAEKTAREKGYTEEAEKIKTIIKALMH